MAPSENVPVFLLHGWAGSFKDTWKKPGIDALLEDIGRTVVGIDLLGHGDQEKPHDPEAYSQLPEWFISQIDATYPVVDAVGFSLGALTLLRAVLLQPHRFRRVVLAGIGNGVFEQQQPNGNQRIIDALEGRAPEDDTFARMFSQYGHQPGNDLAALTAIMKRPPSEPVTKEDLSQLNHDVLVVIGDKDFTFPADKIASALPNGKLAVLKNTDHFATTESFSFIDELLEFLA
jgi:pimeloyl-ACP methyl ester carboxylesterase